MFVVGVGDSGVERKSSLLREEKKEVRDLEWKHTVDNEGGKRGSKKVRELRGEKEKELRRKSEIRKKV